MHIQLKMIVLPVSIVKDTLKLPKIEFTQNKVATYILEKELFLSAEERALVFVA